MPAPVRTDRELLDTARTALARLVDSLHDQHINLANHPRSAEFADGAGILVDPLDADALATALVAAVGDEHDALAAAAAKRAAEYSWDAAAAATVAADREAIDA